MQTDNAHKLADKLTKLEGSLSSTTEWTHHMTYLKTILTHKTKYSKNADYNNTTIDNSSLLSYVYTKCKISIQE